jgi:hypothetical protein
MTRPALDECMLPSRDPKPRADQIGRRPRSSRRGRNIAQFAFDQSGGRDILSGCIIERGSMMQKLLVLGLHFMISTTIMGIFVTAVLSSGHGNGRTILFAALAGFILALPVSWAVVRKITHLVKT